MVCLPFTNININVQREMVNLLTLISRAKIAEKLPGRSKNAVKKRWKELKANGYNGRDPMPSNAKTNPNPMANRQIAYGDSEEKMNVDRAYMGGVG